jgi:RNA polymerase sigma-70 factor (ECF subfamily)
VSDDALSESDAELIARHVAGDPEAFGEIFRRHRDRLWAVALRTLGDPEEAADAVQDAMVSAFRAAAHYRGDAAVTTWLHRIVINACLDRARRSAARPSVPLGDSAAQLAASRDTISARETALDVEQALATLPVEQRAALVLVDMQGFSVDDAARILDIAPGTVKSRCSRARARLLPLLTSGGQDSGQRSGQGNQSGGTGVPSRQPSAQGGGDVVR